ncbi:helix-turn-helix domain-containing protein [Leptonema illini]|uniref:Helix-turn-helix domain protein n=1 Tax=Leptonema illini DSM 21528 TaxID=929563 RepID=H2CKX3_9LEPT|nr:helix-turn-helix transcriptional regulator [Leptonema illini]EHQ06207.1 hypothetical protein Lepil_1519 [Leptonema illini DSM 21528]
MKPEKKPDFLNRLSASLSEKGRENAGKQAEAMLFQIKLAELRKAMGLRQEDVETFSQSSLSKIESRADIKISTLREYLDSIGMQLEIKARPRKAGAAKKKEYVLLKT